MKALRSTMIAALIACSVIVLANADGGPFTGSKHKVINCTFAKAMSIPGLVYAMQTQLNPGFLNTNQQLYTVSVTFDGIMYRITGTEAQWRAFLYPNWKKKYDRKLAISLR